MKNRIVAALQKIVAMPYTRIPPKKPNVRAFYLWEHKENPSEKEIHAEVAKHQVLYEHQEKSFGITNELNWSVVAALQKVTAEANALLAKMEEVLPSLYEEFELSSMEWDEEEVREIFEDFKDAFVAKSTSRDTSLEIYRCIKVPDVQEFIDSIESGTMKHTSIYKNEGLGVYWTWDLKAAKCYWGGAGDEIVVTANATVDDIDVESTVIANLKEDEEREITLIEGSKISVTGVAYQDGTPIWDGSSQVIA